MRPAATERKEFRHGAEGPARRTTETMEKETKKGVPVDGSLFPPVPTRSLADVEPGWFYSDKEGGRGHSSVHLLYPASGLGWHIVRAVDLQLTRL